MIDRTLINRLEVLAKKEKVAKAFSRRLRVKGILIAKSETKKGNLRITVQKEESKKRQRPDHQDTRFLSYLFEPRIPCGSSSLVILF